MSIKSPENNKRYYEKHWHELKEKRDAKKAQKAAQGREYRARKKAYHANHPQEYQAKQEHIRVYQREWQSRKRGKKDIVILRDSRCVGCGKTFSKEFMMFSGKCIFCTD